jgi:hypothetical protein
VFSKIQLALMTNAKLIKNEGVSTVAINCQEVVESDEQGRATLKHPASMPIFVYNNVTGEKITDYQVNGN